MELSDGPTGAESNVDTTVESPKKPDDTPGAECYEDTLVKLPKKPDDTGCTKADQELLRLVNNLKIKVEDGSVRCMVERRGRDISGQYIYLCYPCAAVCSGENILEAHISGKKHKRKRVMRNVWPKTIFDNHPYIQSEKGTKSTEVSASKNTLQKMAAEVDLHNKNACEFEKKYIKYRCIQCRIQVVIKSINTPLIGLEYVIEHPPDEAHCQPSYVCTLCSKNALAHTIINHVTSYWHRHNYLMRHFPKACSLLSQFRGQQYREGVGIILNRLAHCIEVKFGRLRPICINKEEYNKNKEGIDSWIFKGWHSTESDSCTLEEVIDINLIKSLNKTNGNPELEPAQTRDSSPSHSMVSALEKPYRNIFARSVEPQERRGTSLSGYHDEPTSPKHRDHPYKRPRERDNRKPIRSKHGPISENHSAKSKRRERSPNYENELKLALEQRNAAEESAKKKLAYHEKYPEEHPKYREEWKNFWYKRYKEMLAEGKDPSKHDFKPEWIVYWTKRMKEVHDEELRIIVNELYRKLRLTPPRTSIKSSEIRKSPRRRSTDRRRRSPGSRRRSSNSRSRSPMSRRHTPCSGSPYPLRGSISRHGFTDRRSISPGMRKKNSDDNKVMQFLWKSKNDTKTQGSSSDRNETTEPQGLGPPESIVAILRLLVAVEDYLGSIGPKIVDLLTEAIKMEKGKTNSSEELMDRDTALVLIETAKEKLQGSLQVGMVASGAVAAVRNVVDRTAAMLQAQDKHRKDKEKIESGGKVDRSQIAQQMAAALIAQGKTDVSSEELAQLVDAVVGMTEANKKVEARAQIVKMLSVSETDSTSSLQHLVVSENENEKTDRADNKAIKQEIPDAMDCLSESEFDKLLKNAGDLPTEEAIKQEIPDAMDCLSESEFDNLLKNAGDLPTEETFKDIPGTMDHLLDLDFKILLENYNDLPADEAIKEAPGAMDSLSDCDLQILLKNFGILQAEEQNSLAIYLKKLEASEPQRYKKLSVMNEARIFPRIGLNNFMLEHKNCQLV